VGFGEAQLAAHDVGAFDQRHAFVIGDAARQALAAEAAIGGDHEPFGREVFERLRMSPATCSGSSPDKMRGIFTLVSDCGALISALTYQSRRGPFYVKRAD
jgi:hypothetical protein